MGETLPEERQRITTHIAATLEFLGDDRDVAETNRPLLLRQVRDILTYLTAADITIGELAALNGLLVGPASRSLIGQSNPPGSEQAGVLRLAG